MKTLWIINHHATTGEGSVAGARHALLGERLAEHGWRTVILAASTEHYSGRQRVSGWRMRETQDLGNVMLRWLRVPRYAGNGTSRIVNMLAFTMMALLPGSVRGLPRPDAVIGSSVHPLAAWAGAQLARRFNVPFHFEIRDLWPETLIQMGALRRDSLAARGLRVLESHLCSRATRVITTMPYAYEYLESRGIDRAKVVWISNGVELERFPPSTKSQTRKFTFLYFGAFGHANALDVLIDGFAEAMRAGTLPDTKLRLVGQGPERDALQGLIDSHGLRDAVTIERPVPRDEIPTLAAAADVLVVALRDLPLYEFGISLNKLFEYMAAGRPVLFAGKARGNPLRDGGGIVTCCDPHAVANAMLSLRNTSPEGLAHCGRQNRDAVLNFSFEALADKLATALGGDE